MENSSGGSGADAYRHRTQHHHKCRHGHWQQQQLKIQKGWVNENEIHLQERSASAGGDRGGEVLYRTSTLHENSRDVDRPRASLKQYRACIRTCTNFPSRSVSSKASAKRCNASAASKLHPCTSSWVRSPA